MADQEDLQEDKYGALREEFHQLLVPLIRKCWLDKPSDVGMYCARYFQALVEERQGIRISGNENENLQQGTSAEAGGKAGRCEAVPQVQESTSLPLLTDVHRDRLPLRETSSWSSPADSSSLPPRLWDASYDVADAMSRIGDQPAKNGAEEDALDSLKGNAEGSERQLFVGDEGSKDREICHKNNERNDDASNNSVIDEGIASLVDIEVEGELSATANSSSSSIDAMPGTTYRKRWSSNIDSYLDLTLKSEFSESVEGEEEFSLDHNSKRCSPKDETTESPAVVSWDGTSTDACFGSVPRLQELASLAGTEQSSHHFMRKEIEDAIKLTSQSLQDLAKVLDSMKLFCNENLQRVKTLSEALPEKSLRAPRKKRSVTTFSSSDNQFQSQEFSTGPENKPTAASSNKGCSKESKKVLELKDNDSGAESDRLGSGIPLKDEKAEEEFADHKKTAAIEEINVDLTNNLGSSFLDQNLEINGRNTKEDGADSKDTGIDGKLRCKDGIVNRGFVIDDSELYRRSHRLGHHGQNWWQANGYRRGTFNEQSPFSQIRIPRPSSGRNVNLTRNHSQTPRPTPLCRFSYIGEGGDVFSSGRGQCSVATETASTQTTEMAGTFDSRIRSIRIHPVANGNAEQEARPSEKVNGEFGIQVSERDLQSLTSDEQSSKPAQTGSAPESAPTGMDEKVENRIEIKSSKKSSSLNPCAECFNPPSKLVQNLEPLKSPDENDSSTSERGRSDLANVPVELSIESFLDADADWDYEMFLDDILLDDEEPFFYRDLDSDGGIVSLTIEEVEDQHKFENEVCAAERGSLVSEEYSFEENRLMQSRDGASPCEKTEKCKKQNSKSDMKLAEGDQGLEGEEEGAERSESAEKREEPGLSSACGDFVAVENNVANVEENSGDDAENGQVEVAPAVIGSVMGIPAPLNVDDDASHRNRRQEEEIELNFACFSGSDSSEVDSSDFSEEEGELSAENDENILEEKA